MKPAFDNKYLIAYLCSPKKANDFMVLLEFYRFLNNLFYKTKDHNLYQIKLKWLMDELTSTKPSNIAEVDGLKLLMQKYSLNGADVLAMVEAKTVDMDNFPYNAQADLLSYIKATDVKFWELFSQILYGTTLNDAEKLSISNMATAFGILEFIRFAHFKKSKNVYALLYSSNSIKNAQTERENIKALLVVARDCIKKSSKGGRKIKKLLLLNYLSKNFIENLEKIDYKIDDNSISNVSKTTYLKIIFALVFRL